MIGPKDGHSPTCRRMDKTLLPCFVGFAVAITLRAVPTTAQRNDALPNVGKKAPTGQSPQPRRPDSVAEPADGRQQKGNAQQGAPAQSSTGAQALQPANGGDQTPAVARPNEQQATNQSVTVRSLPPVSIEPDWVNYAQIGLTLVVLGLGVWQLVLLRRTVKATEDAATAATDSAKTAQKNVY